MSTNNSEDNKNTQESFSDTMVVFILDGEKVVGHALDIEGYQLEEVDAPSEWYNISCKDSDGECHEFMIHQSDIVGHAI